MPPLFVDCVILDKSRVNDTFLPTFQTINYHAYALERDKLPSVAQQQKNKILTSAPSSNGHV